MKVSAYASRFGELTGYLESFDAFWRDSPYYNLNLAWRRAFPELSDELLALSDDCFQRLDQNPDELAGFLSDFLPGYGALADMLAQLVPYRSSVTAGSEQLIRKIEADYRLAVGVPGRKWQQIVAFITGLEQSSHNPETGRVVDWCAGKSHLGRALAWGYQRDLHFIEHNRALCEAGESMARICLTHPDQQVSHRCVDVLEQEQHFERADTVVALHACGDLHRRLIRQWRRSDSPYLALAPCCYHLWLKQGFVPQSQLGHEQDLKLTVNQVRLAVQEMVTSPGRVQKQSHELKVYRIAFDLLQRELRGIDEYMPTPSLSFSVVAQGAEAVIRLLAEKKGLKLAESLDTAGYVLKARQRYHQIRRLNLATLGFRRAIEAWMALDLVLALEEAGAQVELRPFCDRQLTPRNLLITARR